MPKTVWKPGNMIYPLPVVLVSCGADPSEYTLITIAWTGTACSDPPLCYISVRPERHSHGIIQRTGEFVINLTTRSLAYATDWCGVKSGRDVRKFDEMGLTPDPARMVRAPLVRESPVNIECRVRDIRSLGSHDMFLSEVLTVHVDSQYLDPETGRFDLQKAGPICYSHGGYYAVEDFIGKFGFSVEKKKRRKRRKTR